jgi:hypothetical protein
MKKENKHFRSRQKAVILILTKLKFMNAVYDGLYMIMNE